jgi:hypothetical protein
MGWKGVVGGRAGRGIPRDSDRAHEDGEVDPRLLRCVQGGGQRNANVYFDMTGTSAQHLREAITVLACTGS